MGAGICTVVIVFCYYLLVFKFLDLFKYLACFMILMVIFTYFFNILYTFIIINMSITYYVLGVLGISPQGFLEDLHGYIFYTHVYVCAIVCML